MTYRLDLDRLDTAVTLVFAGEVTVAELEQSRVDLLAALEASGRERVLVDFTWAEARVALEEAFEFTAGHSRVFSPTTRVAIVSPPGEVARLVDFSVTVARNRGFWMRAFGDAEAAARWLAE